MDERPDGERAGIPGRPFGLHGETPNVMLGQHPDQGARAMKLMPVSEVEILDDKELMKEIRRGLRAPKRRLTRREAAELFR